MAKYLKLFEQHAQYETYINGQDAVFPNVSYCIYNDEVHYNPVIPETRLIVTYNVTDTSSTTNIMDSSATSQFSEIEIDGVVQPSVVSSYRFGTTGEHTIKYTLNDPTTIGESAFYGCISLTSVTIPDSVTSIGDGAFGLCSSLATITIPNSVTSIGNNAFESCSSLTSITIPNSVTSIGDYSFYDCSSLTSVTIGSGITLIDQWSFQGCYALTSITIEATTPPTLDDTAFVDIDPDNFSIYVPAQSVEAYKAATNWSSYADRIQAIS